MKAFTKDMYLANEIKLIIQKNHIKVHEKIPSERELTKLLNAQRLNIRGALSILEKEGLLRAKPKVGYFLNNSRVQRDVNSIESTLKIISEDSTETTSLIKFEETEADKYIAKEACVPLGTRMYEIKLLKTLKNTPVCVDYLYVQKIDFPSLVAFNFEKSNFYDILINNYHTVPTRSIQKIQIIKVEENYRELLKLHTTDYVVLQSGNIYGKDGTFIAFIESYINYNYFEYVLK